MEREREWEAEPEEEEEDEKTLAFANWGKKSRFVRKTKSNKYTKWPEFDKSKQFYITYIIHNTIFMYIIRLLWHKILDAIKIHRMAVCARHFMRNGSKNKNKAYLYVYILVAMELKYIMHKTLFAWSPSI